MSPWRLLPESKEGEEDEEQMMVTEVTTLCGVLNSALILPFACKLLLHSTGTVKS